MREPENTDSPYVNLDSPDLRVSATPPYPGLHNLSVNQDNSDLLISVKQKNLDSSGYVNLPFPGLAGSKSEENGRNVNELDILIRQLKQTKLGRNARRTAFEPIIHLTAELLADNHSGAMFYKVLNALYPERLDLYVAAIRVALEVEKDEPQVNQGAVFVRALRDLAEEAGVDLGLKQAAERPVASPEPDLLGTRVPIDSSSTLPPLALPSLNEAIWAETQSILRPQMTRATYDTVIQGTMLIGRDNGTYLIGVPTAMAQAWLENRLRDVVRRALSSVVGVTVSVEFRLMDEAR
jgi:hypothetical protein